MNQQHEVFIRLGFFFSILLIMSLWEVFAPRRTLSVSKKTRWFSNLAIVILDSILIRLLFPMAAVGVAFFAKQHQMGLFYVVFPFNEMARIILSVIILDLVIYFQHLMFHAVPLFWRMHRMHHTDLDFDVTTGLRFHPFEIILSMLIKFAVILLIGAPALAVIIFEILLNATSMFNHGNVKMPFKLDKIIRLFIVTPDMHRVHHSDIVEETNSNFGFNLSLWDRIFGTYKAQPKRGHEAMTIGLTSIRKLRYCIYLLGMLWVPFIKENSEYPINRRKNER